MSKLIEDVLINNNNIKIKSVFGDGSFYDSNENFKYFQEKRINLQSRLKRIQSFRSLKNNNVRNREAYYQLKGLLKYKKRRMYGQRWIAKTAFASIKRMFG
jgi:DNA polymerase III sliding clamp (beta) subunit (PCNA family)